MTVLVGILDVVGLGCFVALVALVALRIDRRFRCRDRVAMCEAESCAGDPWSCVCTLPRGHDGMHHEHGVSCSWMNPFEPMRRAASVTVVEALRVLAAPVPEPFRQVVPNAADRARWQAWHDQYLEALAVGRSLP